MKDLHLLSNLNISSDEGADDVMKKRTLKNHGKQGMSLKTASQQGECSSLGHLTMRGPLSHVSFSGNSFFFSFSTALPFHSP